jgi:phthalate 4,5-dioxygenase
MGPRKEPPPFPAFEINTLPDSHVAEPSIMMEEANWLQNMEGDLDSVHLDFLHRRLAEDGPKPEKGIRGFWNPDPDPPVLDVVTTLYGAYYTAKRRFPDGTEWHRINQFIFPFHTMITTGHGAINLRSFVPLDNEFAMLITHAGHPTMALSNEAAAMATIRFDEVGGFIERTNDPRSYFLTKANKRNDYARDLKVEKETMYNGVPFVGNLQDRAMTELMTNAAGEPIYDRSQEHLGSSDAMVVAVRRQLLEAVQHLVEEGRVPANVDHVKLDRVRSASLRYPAGADWKELSREYLDVDSGKPVAAEVPLVI